MTNPLVQWCNEACGIICNTLETYKPKPAEVKPFNLALEHFVTLCARGVEVHAECVRFCKQVFVYDSDNDRRRLTQFLQSGLLTNFYNELGEMVLTIQPFAKKEICDHPPVPDTKDDAKNFVDAYEKTSLVPYLQCVVNIPRRVVEPRSCVIL